MALPRHMREKLERDYARATPAQRRDFKLFLWRTVVHAIVRAILNLILNLTRMITHGIGAWRRGE